MSKALLVQLVGWFSLPVLVLLTGILVWRRIPRRFPCFFSYISTGVLGGFVRFYVYYERHRAYARLYWVSEIVAALIALLTTCELLVRRLFPRFYIVRFYQFLFPLAVVVASLFAVLAALQAQRLPVLAIVIQVFDVVRVVMLVFLVGLMIFIGRRWTRYELGIAMGLVVEASAWLVTAAFWTQEFLLRHRLLAQLPALANDISALIWLITFLKQERPSPARTAPLNPEVLAEAREWQRSLKTSLGGDS